MIESIRIANVATYGSDPQALVGLSTINFIFGSNGSGKTTISRVIAGHPGHERCPVVWKNGLPMKALVYNRDFVETNFGISKNLKGIFTLGEASMDAIAKIEAAKADVEALSKHLLTKYESLNGADGAGGFSRQRIELEEGLRETCWKQKLKHQEKLSVAFKGARDTKENFKARVLNEWATNRAIFVPLSELHQRAAIVFGEDAAQEAPIHSASGSALVAFETNTVMLRAVLGKQDVDIAGMIKRLGNSDWVKQGRAFYEVNDAACPFCQQPTETAFGKCLEDYFDEAYVTAIKAIDDFGDGYATNASAYVLGMSSMLAGPTKYLDVTALRSELAVLESKVQLNLQLIANKRREPSRSLELESLSASIDAINALVATANAEVTKRNALVANLKREKAALTTQVWRYLLDHELKGDMDDYLSAKTKVEKAIGALEGDIQKTNGERRAKEAEIVALEKSTTSIQPTVDAINGLLAKFGFHGFKLTREASGDYYALNRGDGTDAKHSLSEGERTFVTFLYFYHLLNGSNSDSGITAERVVVFDDPVSSLDSEVLFIVASLIKSVFELARAGKSTIKQVFVLTHNAHFHKEVAFRRAKRKKDRTKDETFWVVRKSGLTSKVIPHETDPIKPSYDMLWNEVRQPDRNNLTIQNTLRRILESYFKILGGIEIHELPEKFEGMDKIACNSLVSWINDGSHFTPDDITFVLDQAAVDNYLRIFREVFQKCNHIEHYKMMMGE